MKVIIYGRNSCHYCQKAKALAQNCQQWLTDFEYRFDDNQGNGWYAKDLTEHLGIYVTTVPQIFIDNKHIGGFIEFEAYLKNKTARNQLKFKEDTK